MYNCCVYSHRLVLDLVLLTQIKVTPQMKIKLQITYMSMCVSLYVGNVCSTDLTI